MGRSKISSPFFSRSGAVATDCESHMWRGVGGKLQVNHIFLSLSY